MALLKSDLGYKNLLPRLEHLKAAGLSESNAFLGWFLENIYRLDETAARDAICDSPNDKGVDGIYVDVANEEIHILQTKLRQNDKAGGENDLKNLSGTLQQFRTAESVQAVLEGGANEELKSRLRELDIVEKTKSEYALKGVYITNIVVDANALEYAAHHDDIMIYDQARIVREYVDLDEPEGVQGDFTFSIDGEVIRYEAGDAATMYLFTASGRELAQLAGIEDQTLFAQNVRLDLGSTPVNRSIRESLADTSSHIKFPLFHNGITLLAERAELNNDSLTVHNYVVVNGAQSISSIFRSRSNISSDLKILLRIVEVGADRELAKRITNVSNNQNAIKPRDQRSNHAIQLRLKSEFEQKFPGLFYYVIKRGEPLQDGEKIENEEADRLLLAYDVKEPWSCHQIYKIFDDDYAKIFARQQVDAARVIYVVRLSKIIESHLGIFQDRKVASYRLTRYFILYVLRQILDLSNIGQLMNRDFSRIPPDKWVEVENAVGQIVVGVITDLDDEIGEAKSNFDYKAVFKSPIRVPDFADTLIKSYNKDLRRGKIESPDKLLTNLFK